MDNIVSRYVYGHEEYDITDSSFEGTIKLTFTRSDKLDAMLVKAELPDIVKDKFIVASAGQIRRTAAQPVGGDSSKLQFQYKSTENSTINIGENTFTVTNNSIDVNGCANVNMNL